MEIAIQRQTNKAIKELNARGVLARKEEKIRKKTHADLLSRGEFLPIGIEIPIRDPEKNPTKEEQEALLPHISLIEKLNELRPPILPARSTVLSPGLEAGVDIEGVECEVEIVTEAGKEPAWVDKDWESSSQSAKLDVIQSMVDSSDAASCLSVDSIAQNADFVGFD